MTKHRAFLLEKNTYAVVSQPIALLVILIIAGVIITLLCISVPELNRESQRQNVERELDKIIVEATTMFEYAENGTHTTIPIEFPASMRFVVFGSIPKNKTYEPTNLSLDEMTSNNYYFVIDDGTIHLFHSNARFSDRTMTQSVLFHPGKYNITLELQRKGEKTYVTMQ